MPQGLRIVRREEPTLLSNKIARPSSATGKRSAQEIWHHAAQPFLSASHVLSNPEAPKERRSKRCRSSRSGINACTSNGRFTKMEQGILRLSSLITKSKVVGGALAVAGCLIWFLMPIGREHALGDLLREQGYWETAPPAEYYLPGTINTIEVRSNGKVAIYPTCKIDPNLLAKVTLHSHTVDRALAERLNRGFDVSSPIKEFLPFGMEGHKAVSATLSLQNSSILQITDEELMLVQREVIKDSCKEPIETNIRNGARVCQTRAALMGDLIFDLTYAADGSALEKGREQKLNMEANQVNADRMVGKGLIYGVNFAPGGIPSAAGEAKPADCQIGSKSKA